MINLIIPICDIKEQNKPDLIDLLNSIAAGGYIENRIICCFDNCQEDFVDEINCLFPFIMGLVNKGNRLQFTRNCNVGIKYSLDVDPNADVMLINQDCILPSWSNLKWVANEGISSLSSTENLDEVNGLLPKHLVRTKVEKVPFYAVYLNNKMIRKIGLLDGVFRKTFSDDSYCASAQLAGFPVESVNITCYHKGSHWDMNKEGTSGSGCYTTEDLGFEMAQYKTRWQIPAQTPHEDCIKWILKNHVWEEEMAVWK